MAVAPAPSPAPTRAPDAATPGPSSSWAPVLPGLVVGAVAAVVGLDRSSLWRDEAYSLGAVHQLGPTLRETRGTMGAYYLLLRAWTTVSDSAVWMRSLSVVLALAALVVVVRLVARVADAATATRAGVFLGLSLLWVAYAQEARSYALVLLLTAVSWTALDHVVADEGPTRRRWLLAHVATAALLPLAQGLAALQLAAQGVALLAGRADRRSWRALAPGLATSVAVTGLLAAVGTGEAGSWVAPVDRDQIRALIDSFTSDVPVLALVLLALAGAGAVLCARAAGAPDADVVTRVRAVAPVAWAVVPPALLLAISLAGRPTLVPRYVMASAAGVAVLWAVASARLDARRDLPLAAVVVTALLALGQVRLHDQTGDDWRAAARAVAAEARPGDVVLLPTSEVRPPFEAAWAEADGDPLAVVGSDRPLGEVRRIDDHLPDDELVEAAQAHERVWVVAEDREGLRTEAIEDLEAAGYRTAGTWAEAGEVPATLLVR